MDALKVCPGNRDATRTRMNYVTRLRICILSGACDIPLCCFLGGIGGLAQSLLRGVEISLS